MHNPPAQDHQILIWHRTCIGIVYVCFSTYTRTNVDDYKCDLYTISFSCSCYFQAASKQIYIWKQIRIKIVIFDVWECVYTRSVKGCENDENIDNIPDGKTQNKHKTDNACQRKSNVCNGSFRDRNGYETYCKYIL